MNLRVLMAIPDHPKLFVDAAAAAITAKRHHPDLELDLLVSAKSVPSWWSPPGPWLQAIHDRKLSHTAYELAIQLDSDEDLARFIDKVHANHRSGVTFDGGLAVKGRWAQTFLSQWTARRFAPFSPYDLFTRVLMGHTPYETAVPRVLGNGTWVVDLDSLPTSRRSWGEELLSLAAASHTGKVLDHVPPAPFRAEALEGYIGGNSALASWLSYHDVPTVLLHGGPFDSLLVLPRAHSWYLSLESNPTPGQALALLKKPDASPTGAFRLTDEFLGGVCHQVEGTTYATALEAYDVLHYVVLNYVNDLREVDLPIPVVTSDCCLRLKASQAAFGKLTHLHQFGIKFLQEFLDKAATGIPREQDLQELNQKVGEVDALAEKTLAAFPELDVFRTGLKFAKSAAQGHNLVEVAKSLILILHESNQAMQAYVELVEAIVRRHTRTENRAGA